MSARVRGQFVSKLSLAGYLVRMEFDRRFAGSAGGKVWVFLGPILSIAVIWTALDFGLGLRASLGPGYGLSLVVGLGCWFFFAEGVSSALGSIVGQPHLVKKVVFPVVLLPATQVFVGFVVHFLLLVLVIVLLGFSGVVFGLNVLLLPFWMLCLLCLTLSVALLVSATNVLIRDASAFVPSAISLLFWITPVVWPPSQLPESWLVIAYLNPAAIIIEGYRSTLLGTPPLLSPLGHFIFAVAMLGFSAVSFLGFRRMRGRFADVL